VDDFEPLRFGDGSGKQRLAGPRLALDEQRALESESGVYGGF
jgi:hypothetical protein